MIAYTLFYHIFHYIFNKRPQVSTGAITLRLSVYQKRNDMSFGSGSPLSINKRARHVHTRNKYLTIAPVTFPMSVCRLCFFSLHHYNNWNLIVELRFTFPSSRLRFVKETSPAKVVAYLCKCGRALVIVFVRLWETG